MPRARQNRAPAWIKGSHFLCFENCSSARLFPGRLFWLYGGGPVLDFRGEIHLAVDERWCGTLLGVVFFQGDNHMMDPNSTDQVYLQQLDPGNGKLS